MKKILTLAVAVLFSAAFATAAPGKKDKKQKKCDKKECCQSACQKLATKNDTISYAAGMFTTRGLMDYVQKQFGVDSTNTKDFVEGIREGMQRQNDKQFMAHVAGLQIAQMVESRIYPNVKNDVTEANLAMDSLKFNAGFISAILGDTTVMNTEFANNYFTTTMTAEKRRQEEVYKKQNTDWLAENAKKEGVKTLPSGLQYKVINQGSGEVAGKEDNVTVRYEGKTIDGTVFDSSYKRNPNTSSFRPDQVIKGWTEALTMMPAGSTWELYIPQELAYGSRAAGKIKPYSTLIFKVELVSIEHKKDDAANDKKAAADSKTSSKPAKKVAAKKAVKRSK